MAPVLIIGPTPPPPWSWSAGRLLWDSLRDMIVIHQEIHKANKGFHVAAAVYTGSDDSRNESPASSLTLPPSPPSIPPFFIQQALITSRITRCPLCPHQPSSNRSHLPCSAHLQPNNVLFLSPTLIDFHLFHS